MRESDHLEKRDRTKFSSGSIGIADLFFTASGLLTLCAVRKNSRKVLYQEDVCRFNGRNHPPKVNSSIPFLYSFTIRNSLHFPLRQRITTTKQAISHAGGMLTQQQRKPTGVSASRKESARRMPRLMKPEAAGILTSPAPCRKPQVMLVIVLFHNLKF